MKKADEEFEGTSESEKEIKNVIDKIEEQLKGYQREKKDLDNYQKQKLDKYKDKDFLSYDNQHIIE